ncbi:MAG: HAD hydrolase-like protein [Eubacteriales bacterium]
MDKFAIKPAPDVLYFIMDFFGVTADECVYVGDSDVDGQFAHNAGHALRFRQLGIPFREGRFSRQARPVLRAIWNGCRSSCSTTRQRLPPTR